MSDQIRVRLVPKTKTGDSIAHNLFALTPASAKGFAPDPDRAAYALRPAKDLGIDAKVTHKGALEGDIPRALCESVFGTTLVEEPKPTSEMATSKTKGTIFTTRQELKVPVNLQDTIAFAYIPNPPLYFGISAIAPKITIHHLLLMELVGVLGAGRCHRQGWTGRGVRVAMTDTGFATHPYFDIQGYTIDRIATASAPDPLVDTVGHGTGESANVLAVAPDCHFIGVKHNDYSAEALETALAQNPRIITNSWGWDIDTRTKAELQAQDPNMYNELRDLENIINDAIDDGVVVIFSAGNGHRAFPAGMPDVIAAGGVTVEEDGSLKASSYASSFRSKLFPGRQVPDFCGVVGEFSSARPMKGHILLPVPSGSDLEGENMPSSKKRKGWGVFSGTSAAAPQLAGVVALMLARNPNLTPHQVKSILAATATDVNRGKTFLGDAAKAGQDNATGAGFINALQACLQAQSLITP